MASLRECARDVRSDLADGIGWVAVWKVGRSWFAERIWDDDSDYDTGVLTLDRDGIDRFHEIIAADPAAVLLNGYYTNVGCDEDGSLPDLDVLTRAIRWQYEECHMLASSWELREAL